MNKYAFLAICLLSALGALLLEVRADIPKQLSTSQLDSVTSKLLPPEFRNTNVSIGKSLISD